MLLVLKDLLTGDLTLGGSGSVGRGVMRGRAALHVPGRDLPLMLDPETTAAPETIRFLNEHVEQFHSAETIPEGT
jgi:hypothetical protein